MPPTSTPALPRLWTSREVAAYAGVHRITIDRLVKAGGFPAPIRIGTRSPRWAQTTVVNFFAAKSAA